MSEWSANNEATRVWAIFSGMYGSRHSRDFGESVPDIWRQAIAGLNHFEIERGLRRLTASGSGSPPTLPQFMKACKQSGDDEGTLRPSMPQLTAPDLPNFCKWRAFGNRVLFSFLCETPARATDDSLQAMIAEKNRIAEQYKLIATECEVSDEEFVKVCKSAFTKQFKPIMVA